MSHKGDFGDDAELGSWREDVAPMRDEAPPLQPMAPERAYTPPPPPPAPPVPAAPEAPPRPSILRRPLAGTGASPGPNNPAPLPSRYR
jgi:hypothetical protein